MEVREGLSRVWRQWRGPNRHQLGVIFIRFLPLMILEASSIMTFESPSMMRQVRSWSRDICIPLIMPHISVELLVSYPRFSAVILCIMPKQSLMTTPAPEGPELPFEAFSKLILWKRGGGGDQIEGLITKVEGGKGWVERGLREA